MEEGKSLTKYRLPLVWKEKLWVENLLKAALRRNGRINDIQCNKDELKEDWEFKMKLFKIQEG